MVTYAADLTCPRQGCVKSFGLKLAKITFNYLTLFEVAILHSQKSIYEQYGLS